MSKCKYFRPGYAEEESGCTNYCEKKKEHLPCCADCKKGKYTVELSWKQASYLIEIIELHSHYNQYGGYGKPDAKILKKLREAIQ